MRYLYFNLFFLLISVRIIYAQAPNISYQTPKVYTLNTTITALPPTNTGGTVPATIYGKVTTFAGNGSIGSTNAVGTNATFYNPYNAAFDQSGNLYIADCNNQLIRKITPAAVVSTFAGSSGFTGYNNGTGTGATFYNPGGVTTDASGNVYVGDQSNNLIRKITPAGDVTTFAGTSAQGMNDGTTATATFAGPAGLVFDGLGNLFIADRKNHAVRKITPAGIVSVFAGNGTAGSANGTGLGASFNNPTSMAVDANNNIYVTDQYNNLIRKITQAGVVTTFAGSGFQGSTNGTAGTSSFNKPFSLSFDVSGNLYLADEFNHLIRQVTPSGVVTTLAGSGQQGNADGVGTAATFNFPAGVIPDGLGNLYVTETTGQKIRKIVITGYVIDKPLPAGLVFDQTTGIISGTPTAISAPTDYLVVAYNKNGSSSTIVNISVAAALLPQIIIFTPISNVPYGTADITPIAVSTNPTIPITYTSSNTAVATITADGKIHIVGAGTVTITASQAGNALFTPATPVSQTFTVTPVPLNVTIADETKVYGSANPAAVFTYSGFVNGDNQTKLTALPVISTTVTVTSPVGTYGITGTGAASPNYTITYTAGKLTVTPAPLTITAVNASRVYGVANPAFTVTYTGFVAGDDASKLTTAPTIATTANITTAVGIYAIDASGAVDGNYNITYVSGKLTITPVSRTLTFNPIPTKGAGDPDFDPGATTSTNDVVIYTSSDPSVAIIVNGKIHIVGPGTAVITATVASRANYADIPPQTQILTVLVDPSQFVAIHPVVTPNGDGINDVLKIDGIANYPNNKITLVNLNGIKVFEADSYDNINNTFDGHSNITGSFQPQGTYYYSLQFIVNGQKKRRVGFIVLKY